MKHPTTARTARKAHPCEECHEKNRWWRVEVPTIFPGHRYLHHVALPDGEINTGEAPYAIKECVDCATRRLQWSDSDGHLILLAACRTACCGEVACALPVGHEGDHSCRSCAVEKAVAR